jgi:hypothetical protein
MAPLTSADVKDYLRIQSPAEDVLIMALIARASAAVGAWLQRPVYNVTRTITVFTSNTMFAANPRTLFLPFYPIASITSITDSGGVAIPAGDIAVDTQLGSVSMKNGGRFAGSPYTIVVVGGLESHSEFLTLVEPAINQATLDVVSDLYQRRNPAAAAEREGGGIAVEYVDGQRSNGTANWREDMLTPRVQAFLAPWRIVGITT